jgi:hypothetical protein
MAKAKATRVPPPAEIALVPWGTPRAGGGRGSMLGVYDVYSLFCFVLFCYKVFNLVVKIGGGRGVGAVGALTALATGRWRMRTNQRMSARAVAQ